MRQIDKRLTELEQRRHIYGPTIAQEMSDAQLIRIITGGQATEISDAQLERIAAGGTI